MLTVVKRAIAAMPDVQSAFLSCTRYFVVAERSRHGAPMAYVYQYPSLAIEQTLEHGTERAYSAAAFNATGDRLATVGSYPDFMLTVWDWKSGCTLLRSKAFSQEVYCVSFCPSSDGALVTSGIVPALQLLFVLSVSRCMSFGCWTVLQNNACQRLVLALVCKDLLLSYSEGNPRYTLRAFSQHASVQVLGA